MTGKEKLMTKLEGVLAASKADQTEIVYIGTESGLTRYANSYIHQNVYENNSQIFFRSIVDNRIGVASTNSLVTADLKKTLADSLEIARNQPPNPRFPGLPRPAKYKDMRTFDEVTARFSPRDRARVVKKVIARATRKKFTMAGSFSSGCGEVAVLNSLGVRAYQPVSGAAINMIAMSDTSSGYAALAARGVEEIDFDALAQTAVEKCDTSQNPRQIDPGEYEVILEPAAIVEILDWLGYIGFGSKMYEQKMSFLSGRIGRKITSDQITFYDSGSDKLGMNFPFDFEGVPKKKVAFIDKGVVRGVVYDRMAAAKAKTKSTGHALPANWASEGALPMNVIMGPGKAKKDSMIASVKRGILVTRFHYINGYIDTKNSMLTGMTRDGTFLIENGEVVGGLKNLRFTDSMMRAFKSTVAISRETERHGLASSMVGCTVAPTVHLGSFKFTGRTEF